MTLPDPDRVVAVDWSGAGANEDKPQPGIWLADWSQATGIRLTGRLARSEVAAWLTVEAKLNPSLVVGLDFSFGFPEWFTRRHGGTARDVWKEAERHGDGWLEEARYPFWRAGKHVYPEGESPFRKTELADRAAREWGSKPKSVFQLVGDGQVGAASVRGMRTLRRLDAGGFHIWPFDEPAWPLAVEIYPSAGYPRGARTSAASRSAYLSGACFAGVNAAQKQAATGSGDAFDALTGLLTMLEHRACFARLPAVSDAMAALEGEIWRPATCVCAEPPVH